tara:strand:- start:23624 stop:24283 length:660 start_codon:yes stop_codon:yes gene_type:complete
VNIKKYFSFAILIASASLAFLTSSCEDPNSPGLEYMPDMYRSPALEAYSESDFWLDSMATRKPVANTIPRGYMPFEYPNTAEGYELAGKELKNPIPYSEAVVKEGKEIYETFCYECHGMKGKGDGPVASNPRWPGPPPAYDGRLKDLPEGQIFFSIHYGKNMMGSHASQISQEDRWKLVYYVQQLQGHDLEKMYGSTAEVSTEDSPATVNETEESNEEA